jgi:hypothetical protein
MKEFQKTFRKERFSDASAGVQTFFVIVWEVLIDFVCTWVILLRSLRVCDFVEKLEGIMRFEEL